MMGHQSRQMAMIFVDIESLIPETHLLRKIERMVSFDFIYDLLAPYYPETGRPSVELWIVGEPLSGSVWLVVRHFLTIFVGGFLKPG